MSKLPKQQTVAERAPAHHEVIRAMLDEYEQAAQRVMRMATLQADFREIMLRNNRQRQNALNAALAGIRIAGLDPS